MINRVIALFTMLLLQVAVFAQGVDLNGEPKPHLSELLGEKVSMGDDFKTRIYKYRAEFREKYEDQLAVCNSEDCKIKEYFELLAGEAFYSEGYESDHPEDYRLMKSFFQEELAYLKAQGLDLMAAVKTPVMPKVDVKLFFVLYEGVASGLSAGVFSHASLAMTKALIDEGYGMELKVGYKGKLGDRFGDHLMARFLGLVDDPMVDSTPELPAVDIYRQVFDTAFFTQFRWKGRSLHTTMAELLEPEALYLIGDLDGLGYDLAKADTKKGKGKTGLMVLGKSWYAAFYSEYSEEDEKAMVDMLKRYGAALNMQDRQGNTALHYAALNGTNWYFKALLQAGADASIKNKRGEDVRAILDRKVTEKKDVDRQSSVLGSGKESEPFQTMLELLSRYK